MTELSELLQSLPIHPAEVCGPKFRNLYGFRQKMADIATLHLDSSQAHRTAASSIWKC